MLFPELACDPTQHADLAAVVMQEGLANICLVTPSMTLLRAKIETPIPRKRRGSCSQHDKVRKHQVAALRQKKVFGSYYVLKKYIGKKLTQFPVFGWLQ